MKTDLQDGLSGGMETKHVDGPVENVFATRHLHTLVLDPTDPKWH